MNMRSLSYRAAAVGAAVLLTAGTAAGQAQDRPVDRLTWIVGCWSMQTARGETITESWTRAAPDTLAGLSRTVREGREVGSETMHIFRRGDDIIFAALPSGQAYTEFTARHVSADSAVFENPAHDFPQRVSYTIAGDSLHARVSGTMNGSAMSFPFPMKRLACGG